MATDVTAALSTGGDEEPRQANSGDGGVAALATARAGTTASSVTHRAAPRRSPAIPPAAREAQRRRASRGRHAAPKAGVLSTRGARFVLFSAIGASVFVLGLAIQYVLTGKFHLPSMWSYLIQAVVSVETNFLLNRWLTWRDRAVPFWTAFIRFNGQRTVTVALNSLLYLGLIRLGMNYLVANIVLTAAFTVVNYLVGDLFVFTPRRTKTAPEATFDPTQTLPLPRVPRPPDVSVVIPCRNNQATIRATVLSVLGQNYPGLRQVTLIGSPGDATWAALAGIDDPRLEISELATPPGVRDANFKRDHAIRKAASDLIALVDSDVVLPGDWMSRAIDALDESRASCVTGGMRSVRDDFWGRYTDHTVVGAKTPRVARSYVVTRENFGVRGRKPPITANILFKREFYDECPINPYWSHGSYEDYEWFWRVVKSGYQVRVCWELFGWHHHRQGMRALIREYRRSSRGCAYFIRAHLDAPLARRRLLQAVALPLLGIVTAIGLGAGAAAGYAAIEAEAALAAAVLIAGFQAVRSRRIEGVAYAATGITLGLVFTTGLVTNLLRASTGAPDRATLAERAESPPRGPLRYLLHPLTLICAVQAALSLTLVWSNTAFTDEADYLWLGRLRLANWLHGTAWPSATGQHLLPGSPDIYPPIGAIADAIGGLSGARIASLAFMLGATVLLYFAAQRLFDATVAAFAAGLWAVSEPAIRLAFATADPLSVALTALAAWLIAQAGYRSRHGELVAAAGVTLALATATSYSAIIIDPMVIAFAFAAWLPRLGARQAAYSAGWLAATLALFLGLLLTVSGSWSGFAYTAFGHYITTHQGATQILNDLWDYAGLIVVLAVVGAIVAAGAEGARRAVLVGLLGCAALVVPAVQLLTSTTDLADRHLAYGALFGAMAAGYACTKVIRWLPSARRQFTLACCAAALIYPASTGWQSAWGVYHGWPDARALIASFAPAAARTQGYLYAASQTHVVEYYTPQVSDSARWSTGQLPLDPTTTPTTAYYATQLRNANYGLIALFYSTSFTSANLPASMLTSPQGGAGVSSKLLGLVSINSDEPGLLALTQALEQDHAYRLLTVGPYDSAHEHGVFAIWRRVTP